MLTSDAVFLSTLKQIQAQHFDTTFAFIEKFKNVLDAAPEPTPVLLLAPVAA